MAESIHDKYAEKIADLKKHVPFIEMMINHLKTTKEKCREAQLKKMESLLQMITDTNKKWKYEILLKCEEVIVKLKCRMKTNVSSEPPKQDKTETIKSSSNKADKSDENDATNSNEIPPKKDNGLVEVSSNSDDDFNDMNHQFHSRQNFQYRNYSHRKYRPFTKAEASNQTVILPLLLEAMKDGSNSNRDPRERKFETYNSNQDRLSPVIGNFKNRFNSTRGQHHRQFYKGSTKFASYRHDTTIKTTDDEDDRIQYRNSENPSSSKFESDILVGDELNKTQTRKKSPDNSVEAINKEESSKNDLTPFKNATNTENIVAPYEPGAKSEFDSLKITHTIEIDPRILLNYSQSIQNETVSKSAKEETIKMKKSKDVSIKTENLSQVLSNEVKLKKIEKKRCSKEDEANYSKLDRMYSNLTTTGTLTSSIEALYSGSAPTKTFKIPKKQNKLKIEAVEKKEEQPDKGVKDKTSKDKTKKEAQIEASNEFGGDKIKKKKKKKKVVESDEDSSLVPKPKNSNQIKKRKSISDEEQSKKTKIEEKPPEEIVQNTSTPIDSKVVIDEKLPTKSSDKIEENPDKTLIPDVKNSAQIKELNLAKEIFKNTPNASGSTNLLEFFLDNFKQIKKMFESSDSEDESSSKKKKRKRRKKKKHRKKYSSSSSSSSSSDEEGRSKKKKKKEERKCDSPKLDEEVDGAKSKVEETKSAPLKEDITGNISGTSKDVLPKKKVNEQKPRKNELDFLHEDIKEMWMSVDIVRATGRRACTITKEEVVKPMNAIDENDDDTELRKKMIENASKLKVWIKRDNFASYFNKISEKEAPVQLTTPPLVKKRKPASPKKIPPIEESKDEHHDKDYYVQGVETPCRLCNYKGKMIFTHYKAKHHDNEVLISRFPPKIAEQLIVTSTERNYKNVNLQDGPKLKYTFICPFCPNNNVISDVTAQFYDHLTIHTGEYRYFCESCDFTWYNTWNMRYHNKIKHKRKAQVIIKNIPLNSEIVFGYICLECHFVQISKRNLEKHIQNYHGNSAGILKINLNLNDAPDKINEPVEDEITVESELNTQIKVEEPQIQNNLKAEIETQQQNISDLSPFICEDDIINEKNVEQVRLEKMNDILGNVNIQNIRITMADKLQTKLVFNKSETELKTYSKKDYKSYPKSKPSRLFVNEIQLATKSKSVEAPIITEDVNSTPKEVEKPPPLFSEKTPRSISSIINRLQDNLQPSVLVPPQTESATTTEAMPSLIHYKELIPDIQPQKNTPIAKSEEEPPPLSHYKNLMDSNQKNEILLSAGPIRILRNPAGTIIYACFIARCVFSSENWQQFATHCRITHAKLNYKSWKCKLCNEAFINNGLYDVFMHLLQRHLEPPVDLSLEESGGVPQRTNIDATIDISSDSSSNSTENFPTVSVKKDYIRPVPLFKLLEDSDSTQTPPPPPKIQNEVNYIPDEMNVNNISKKSPYIIDCQLNGPQAAHFYKCPVFNCTFSSFAVQDFVTHISLHQNCYVFCLYCSNIIKLSLYFNHLEENHFSARFACSRCFYRGNNMSYVSAHIDTHHKGMDRQMVVTPSETMPTGVPVRDEDLPAISTLIKPYKCAQMGCQMETIFCKDFMDHISTHKSKKDVVCADCGRTLNVAILRHYAAQHGVCAFHCRYCQYGSQSADQLIRHLSELHSNLPFLILSRKRHKEDVSTLGDTDEFSSMFQITERMIKSKYTTLTLNKDVQSVLSGTPQKKKTTTTKTKRSANQQNDLISYEQACIELSASIAGDEEISLYSTDSEPKKRSGVKKQAKNKKVVINQMSFTRQSLTTPSTSETTPDELPSISSLSLDGTIYPSCKICGLQVTNKMCSHLTHWNTEELHDGRVITSHLVRKQGSEVIVRNKLVADGIVQPEYVATNRYVCGGEDCELIFESKVLFEEHLQLFHANDSVYTCPHCSIRLDFLSGTVNIALMMKHAALHEQTIYKCRYCYYMDDEVRRVQEHTIQMHPKKETVLLKITRRAPAAGKSPLAGESLLATKATAIEFDCNDESEDVDVVTNSDDEIYIDDNSSSVINDEGDGVMNEGVEDRNDCGPDLAEDDVNLLNIITGSTTQELDEKRGLIKPYGPHYRPEKDCYKCPICADAIHGALKFNNHLLGETSRIKGIYLNKTSSIEDVTNWIHKVIRHQTLILHFWMDTSNMTMRVCRFCPAMCWKKRWYIHEMIHFDNAKPFQCNTCQYECFSKESIDYHMYKHVVANERRKKLPPRNPTKPANVKTFHEITDDEKFLFEICPTSDFENLETIPSDKIRKVCFYCKFQGNYIEIVKHCKQRHGDSEVRGFSFKCLTCEDYFETARLFSLHNSLCHDGKAEASFNYVGDRLHACIDCGKTYYDRRLLKLHMKTHSNSYICKYCEFVTYNWRLLLKHHFDAHIQELFDFMYDFDQINSEVTP